MSERDAAQALAGALLADPTSWADGGIIETLVKGAKRLIVWPEMAKECYHGPMNLPAPDLSLPTTLNLAGKRSFLPGRPEQV